MPSSASATGTIRTTVSASTANRSGLQPIPSSMTGTIAAPKTRKVAALKPSATVSIISAAFSSSDEAIAPNARPAVNAAISPLPWSTVARP